MISRPAHLLSLTLAAALAAVAGTGCSPAARQPAASSPADPATPAQIDARLLIAGTAPGFRLPSAVDREQPTRAQPFAPPRGSQACNDLSTPELFAPGGTLDAGQVIGIANAGVNALLPPMWFERIDVYPGTEAAGVIRALPALIARCAHFQMSVSAPGPESLQATEAAAPMTGLGRQALYVTVRVAARPGAFLVNDWVVIRSDRTLIWVFGQAGASSSGTGQDALTLRLARAAWHRYQAGAARG